MSERTSAEAPTTPHAIYERMGGFCMLDAQQAAERYFLGQVVTSDVVKYYEYPVRVPQLASHDEDIFNLRLCYLLANLKQRSIGVRKPEYPIDYWQPDDFSKTRRHGIVWPPIPRVAVSGADALGVLPGNLALPLLLATFDERSGKGHVWFASDTENFENDKQRHLVELNSQADNVYAGELYKVS